MLLLLRQPHLRMVYVTSVPVDPRVVEYYLALLPGVIPSHARSRLSLVSVGDAGPEPLTAKLLARPRLLADIVDLVPDRARCHLVPYTTTRLERDLALSLGIGMYGADPRLFPLGTKTGCRRLFARAGVPHPAGAEDVRTTEDVVAALAALRRRSRRPWRRWSSWTRGWPGGERGRGPRRVFPRPVRPTRRRPWPTGCAG